MTYYLENSEWMMNSNVPEGMNIDMVNDPFRVNDLLKPGISEIAKESVIIDLGCGTGMLGLHALSQGAKFVYFVEQSEQMAHILRNVLPNKIDQTKFKIINKNIKFLEKEDFDGPTPDYAVSEFFGPRLFDEGYTEYSKKIKSLIPSCQFIPEIFKLEIFQAEVDYTQYPWPFNVPEMIDHYKFMYKEKGFGGWPWQIEMIKPIKLGEIVFNANTQEFSNSAVIGLLSNKDCMVYGVPYVVHRNLPPKKWNLMGWFVEASSLPRKYKIYFDIKNSFNPRMDKCEVE